MPKLDTTDLAKFKELTKSKVNPTLAKAKGLGKALLSREDRLSLFKEQILKAPKPKSTEEAITLINKTLDNVEDLYSGVPKNYKAARLGQTEGRMYGILDDQFVTHHSDGSLTALTRGHKINIKPDGSFSIFDQATKKLFLEK